MCGIISAVSRRNVIGILLEGLARLEYRGYDSSGLAILYKQSLLSFRQAGKVRQLKQVIQGKDLSGFVGLAHTRWATHGQPSEANAHPHISHNEVAVVHNGIIENYADLYEELKGLGYKFTSETDSEVIPHLVHYYLHQGKEFLEAFNLMLERLTGSFSLVCAYRREPEHIIAASKGCPLVIGLGIEENYIASDVLALRAVTDRVVFMEEGDVAYLSALHFDIYDVQKDKVERRIEKVDIERDDLDKGKYRHYMQKEIFEQVNTVKRVLEGRLGKKQIFEKSFGNDVGEYLDKVRFVTIVGCGSSFLAALVAKYWIEEYAAIPCHVEIASEFRYRKHFQPEDGHLFVSLSQSGETADILAALSLAKTMNYFATLAICNVATSTLVRACDLLFLLKAGSEIGVASTKAFTAQLIVLLMFTALLARRNKDTTLDEAALVADLNAFPEAISGTLSLDDKIREFAFRFVDKDHALFLGRGPQYPIALEGALKLKEISYIHAEGYAAGELKHGPLALIDEDMLVVVVAPNDNLLEKFKSNMHEVRARGGKLFIFADDLSAFEPDVNMSVILLPKVNPLLAPILYTIPLQLLAYYVALFKGTDIDQPRNLAKSVTVE